MAAHLTNEQRQLVFRLRHRGLTTVAIAREIGLTWEGAAAVLRGQKREARLDAWTSAPGRLSVPEREEILLGLHHGLSMRAIARALGRAPSTITREVKANGGRECYRIWPAHQRARACIKRPKSAKLDAHGLGRCLGVASSGSSYAARLDAMAVSVVFSLIVPIAVVHLRAPFRLKERADST